jgi:hypothetical protein
VLAVVVEDDYFSACSCEERKWRRMVYTSRYEIFSVVAASTGVRM